VRKIRHRVRARPVFEGAAYAVGYARDTLALKEASPHVFI
jgi:hypothetical protein